MKVSVWAFFSINLIFQFLVSDSLYLQLLRSILQWVIFCLWTSAFCKYCALLSHVLRCLLVVSFQFSTIASIILVINSIFTCLRIYFVCMDGKIVLAQFLTCFQNNQLQPQMVGIAPARVPLPLDLAEDGPIYVNAKQYHGILRRRQIRAKLEAQNKLVKTRRVCITFCSFMVS